MRSIGRQAGSSGSSAAGGRTNRRPCWSHAPKSRWLRWASIRETLFAPPSMVGQRNWMASSSQKQMGQTVYDPGISSSTRCPQQGQGQRRLTGAVLSMGRSRCHVFPGRWRTSQSADSPQDARGRPSEANATKRRNRRPVPWVGLRRRSGSGLGRSSSRWGAKDVGREPLAGSEARGGGAGCHERGDRAGCGRGAGPSCGAVAFAGVGVSWVVRAEADLGALVVGGEAVASGAQPHRAGGGHGGGAAPPPWPLPEASTGVRWCVSPCSRGRSGRGGAAGPPRRVRTRRGPRSPRSPRPRAAGPCTRRSRPAEGRGGRRPPGP